MMTMLAEMEGAVREGMPIVAMHFRAPKEGEGYETGKIVDRILKAAGVYARLRATQANEHSTMLRFARLLDYTGEALRPLVPHILGVEMQAALPPGGEGTGDAAKGKGARTASGADVVGGSASGGPQAHAAGAAKQMAARRRKHGAH